MEYPIVPNISTLVHYPIFTCELTSVMLDLSPPQLLQQASSPQILKPAPLFTTDFSQLLPLFAGLFGVNPKKTRREPRQLHPECGGGLGALGSLPLWPSACGAPGVPGAHGGHADGGGGPGRGAPRAPQGAGDAAPRPSLFVFIMRSKDELLRTWIKRDATRRGVFEFLFCVNVLFGSTSTSPRRFELRSWMRAFHTRASSFEVRREDV